MILGWTALDQDVLKSEKLDTHISDNWQENILIAPMFTQWI